MADENRRARLCRDCPPRGLRCLMQRGQRVLHAGAVDALLLEAGDDLRPAGAVCEQSVYEDDILRLWRCLGAGDSIEQGKGGASSDSPDQCPAVHRSLLLKYGRFGSVMGKSPRAFPAVSGLSRSAFAENCFGAALASHAANYRAGDSAPAGPILSSLFRNCGIPRCRAHAPDTPPI